ncbi:MAG TPA: aminotransferase class IV [Flavobacteriaceae bacterium]|nr:aminotransferase class IV [Flavobacteriaceae bacterium]
MINHNSKLLQPNSTFISTSNRALKYGDGLFETIKVINNNIVFLENHYFRLMASMRMLRMEIPMEFNLDFFENEILKTVEANELVDARIRFVVYRKNGGLYLPKTNNIDFYIEVSELSVNATNIQKLDLYKDFLLTKGALANLKTTNRLVNVLASIYCEENEFDNCVLLNNDKYIAETINSNIFLVFDSVVKTPALTEGCIKGVTRKKVIEIIKANKKLTIEEVAVSPFELQRANEVFLTNAIQGVQVVENYRKTTYETKVGMEIKNQLENLI